MFDSIYEWIRRIAYYLVIVTAVLHIVPNLEYRRYIRFFTGLILVMLLAGPVLALFDSKIDINGLYNREEYEKQLEKMELSLEQMDDMDMIYFTESNAENDSSQNVDVDEIGVEEIRVGR